ncbi:hypothetical protein MATL_G00103730 [Megalops atlanticus]|uniref:Regulator of telomere elongation helicase 1 n=1 Tax=Megalops atlanticus TaxID=7932 RepID=A0A9D3Q3I8_MEGAT|nr:hypothetical protein MATL_G00103730 [Megalops atlanticus]
MPPLTLRGITVDFPFTPYECQKEYMKKVIECLQNKVNGVLESPTGTGKTLCLLCATLAWREYFKDTISARKIAEKMGGAELFPDRPLSSWGTAATDGDTPAYYTDIPKIIYASRTHSQLTQVINELKNTSYRPKVCVLGSREQLCINPEVMRQESNHVKVHMCRAKISSRSCVYYNNVEEKSTDKELTNTILDVEDLVKAGNKQRVCPYYLSRSLKQQADIVFMPYNYLLDPKSRRAHNIELKGAVVIFDEAHNVEKMCEESTSFDLTPYDLASAIDTVDKLLVEQARDAGKADLTEDFNVESLNSGLKLDITTIAKIKQILLDLEAAIDSFEMPSNDQGITKPGSWETNILIRPFPVCLENPHVIQRDQIFVSVIDKGPDGVQLSSAFDRRFVPENMASLGNTIVNLGRVVPHGLLVFFPSYPVMDKTLEFWKAKGHADRIENLKPMFVEPKGKGTFTEVMDGYYNKINDPKSKGGSFFAVCRGKASEGLDFADTYGRGVVITGLPFPPRMDPRVILKMQYLDEMRKKPSVGAKYLSGQEWYRQQASRAVNQAIGRVIRHREDYGAIFLCDHRFNNSDARSQLPSWVRPYIRTHDNFGNIVRDVAQFFKVAQKLRPPPEKKRPAASCGGSSSSEGACASDHASQAPLSSFMPKAKSLDSHVPSLKKRKLNDHTAGEGAARLCIQYETHMEDSRRRPAGLLDALEDSDRRAGEGEEEQLVGEEKASRLSTLSLQYDKRMDDESRGGKRKIRVVQEQTKALHPSVSEESKAEKAKAFLAAVKRSLSQVNFHRIMNALQKYKRVDDLDDLLMVIVELFTQDTNTHVLLREFYQFIRPHHKKQFDETCRELTGIGCGYKPEHSLSKEEKEKLMQQKANAEKLAPTATLSTDSESAAVEQLNTSVQLNKGGSHLSTHGLSKVNAQPSQKTDSKPPDQSAQKTTIYSTFVTDVKKAIGIEKSNQLFKGIQDYKKTDNYDNMVSTVVSLLTEKSEDFHLLRTFAMFVRPHHKQQFLWLLHDLAGDSNNPVTQTAKDLLLYSSLEVPVSRATPVTSQSKISSFFSSSQRK